jgi:hypothetical protein
MKLRLGFVSNSSSSSFIVSKDLLSVSQLELLQRVCESSIGKYHDSWNVYVEGDMVRGFTGMDNGGEECGLKAWMQKHRFPMDNIKWDYD